jgi:hypothetical protein
MANEYGELEQLVNDVTSLDTARMTLRWALERLNTIEKEKADLKKNLALAEETSKKLQLKENSLQDAYTSRSKTLEEKEDFYTKLEATMSLLGEGKLDIQQLLKKEAKLDSLRKNLENEYQEKFDDLDRNQRSVIERWNARLLEVESQYAGRLTDAQKKYDSLRSELETEYQSRMTSLQTSFKSREKELGSRIEALEGSVKNAEDKVETRRKALESEYLLKQREIEENYRKVKASLEANFDDKLRAMDSDHMAQVRSLEASWQTERNRLLEEQRVREDQFASAQTRLAEVENRLAAQQEMHHSELLKVITEKENAFRAQVAELEKEKAQKEATVKELIVKLEQKSTGWAAERAALEAEFGLKLAGIESVMNERVSSLASALAAKEQELEAFAERHRAELVERVQAGEASFRARLETFEEEKRSYNETIKSLGARLEEAARAAALEKENFRSELAELSAKAEAKAEDRNAVVRADYEARKADLEKNFAARYEDRVRALEAEKARMAEALAEREKQLDAAFKEARQLDTALAGVRMRAAEEKTLLTRDYEREMVSAMKNAEDAARARDAELRAELEVLRNELAEKDRLLSQEKGRLVAELSKASLDAHNRSEERAAAVRAEYEAKLSSLEASVENRMAELKQTIAAKEALLEDSFKAREAAEKTLKAAFEAEKAGWTQERARMAADFDKRLAEIESGLVDRTAGIRADYELRKADLEKDFAARYEDRLKALEAEKARMAEALAEREGQLEAAFKEAQALDSALAGLRMRAAEEKTILSREYEKEMSAALKNAEDAARVRDAGLRADIEALRGELVEKDRLLSQEKGRLVAELSKASLDAHNRNEERASVVKAEYEARLASLEAAAESREEELRQAIAAKEALLERALAERAAAEASVRSEFERKRSALEEALAARAATLEADYAAHKERLAAELAARTDAVQAEAAAKAELERGNWAAERSRIERALEETSSNFRAAQKDIAELNKGLRKAEEFNAQREAELSHELMEAKSNFDKELAYRVKDAVGIQTAHLVESLESSKAKQEELYKHLEAKDEAIRSMRTEAEESRRVYENKILDASSGALKERREELERHYAAKSAALEEEMSSFRRIMEAENEALRAAMEQAREEVLSANKRADDTFNDMLKASKAVQEEKLEINRLRTDEFNAAVAEAVRKATEATAQKLRHTEAELVRIQEVNRDEVNLLTEAFNKEKDRMLEEIVRRENYLESADLKIQEQEQQMAALRQNSSVDLMRHVSEQDKRFRDIVTAEKARYEARIKQMEELLAAKERLLADSERVYRQKQVELDSLHSELNASVSRFNEDLFAQRQALSEKEKSITDLRLKLEKDYGAKAADLEKMKTELAHAIMDYKNRK